MEDEGIQIRRHLSRRAGHRVDAGCNRTAVSRRVRVGERAVERIDDHGLGLAGVRVGDLDMREGINRGVVIDRLIGDRAGNRWVRRDRNNACCVVGGELVVVVEDQDRKPGRHGLAGGELMGGWMEDDGIQIRRHLSR